MEHALVDGWPIIVSICSTIVGATLVWAKTRELEKNLKEQRDRHDDLVEDIVKMKSKMNDEIAKLTVSMERIATTLENFERWLKHREN